MPARHLAGPQQHHDHACVRGVAMARAGSRPQCLTTMCHHSDYVTCLSAARTTPWVASGGLRGELFLIDAEVRCCSAPCAAAAAAEHQSLGAGQLGQAATARGNSHPHSSRRGADTTQGGEQGTCTRRVHPASSCRASGETPRTRGGATFPSAAPRHKHTGGAVQGDAGVVRRAPPPPAATQTGVTHRLKPKVAVAQPPSPGAAPSSLTQRGSGGLFTYDGSNGGAAHAPPPAGGGAPGQGGAAGGAGAAPKGLSAGIYSVALSSHGNVVAAGSSDGFVRLWDCRSGEKISKLRGHTDNIRWVRCAWVRWWVCAAARGASGACGHERLAASGRRLGSRGWRGGGGRWAMGFRGAAAVAPHTRGPGRLGLCTPALEPTGVDCLRKRGVRRLRFARLSRRCLLIKDDLSQMLSGSSDRTIRLWDLGMQRCVQVRGATGAGGVAAGVDAGVGVGGAGRHRRGRRGAPPCGAMALKHPGATQRPAPAGACLRGRLRVHARLRFAWGPHCRDAAGSLALSAHSWRAHDGGLRCCSPLTSAACALHAWACVPTRRRTRCTLTACGACGPTRQSGPSSTAAGATSACTARGWPRAPPSCWCRRTTPSPRWPPRPRWVGRGGMWVEF